MHALWRQKQSGAKGWLHVTNDTNLSALDKHCSVYATTAVTYVLGTVRYIQRQVTTWSYVTNTTHRAYEIGIRVSLGVGERVLSECV